MTQILFLGRTTAIRSEGPTAGVFALRMCGQKRDERLDDIGSVTKAGNIHIIPNPEWMVSISLWVV